jgi:hypothetical protein
MREPEGKRDDLARAAAKLGERANSRRNDQRSSTTRRP